MYGTVAKCIVKPENREALLELSKRQIAEREVAGYVTSYMLFENDSDVCWLFAVFEDFHSYTANADSPEQGRCSRHGIAFDLTNGRPLNASCPPLQRLPLAFHGDRIGLDL